MFYKVETFSQKKMEKKFYTQREINNVKEKQFREDKILDYTLKLGNSRKNSSRKLELSKSCKLFKFKFVTRTARLFWIWLIWLQNTRWIQNLEMADLVWRTNII